MTKRIAIPEETIAVLLDSAESEVEELLSEIESWKENLEGASMEHLPKYDEVTGCYEALETARDTLQSAVEDARLLPAEILAVPIAMKAIPGRHRSRGRRLAGVQADLDAVCKDLRERGGMASVCDDLETAITEMEQVDFPGMYS
jgi:hypothetical protein